MLVFRECFFEFKKEGHDLDSCHHLWESIPRTRQHLPTLPPRLLWPPFFNSVRSMVFRWFSDGGRRWSRKGHLFYGVVFEENEINTLDHTLNLDESEVQAKQKVNVLSTWICGWKPRNLGNFPPQKKTYHTILMSLGWWSLSGFLWCSSRWILRTTWSVPRESFAKLQKGSFAQSFSTKQ